MVRALLVVGIFLTLCTPVFAASSTDHGNISPATRVDSQSLLIQYLTKDLDIEDPSRYVATLQLAPLKDEAETFFSKLSAPTIAKIYLAFAKNKYNNAILLGAPGVGKSYQIQQLVAMLSWGVVPEYLKPLIGFDDERLKQLHEAFLGKTDVVYVNMDLLTENPTKSKDPYSSEKVRIKKVVSGLFEAAKNEYKRSKRRTLFIMDEAATMEPSVKDSLKKPLDTTGFKDPTVEKEVFFDVGTNVVAMTTPDEYHKMVAGDGAVERRYEPVRIFEPSEEQAVELLIEQASKLQKRWSVEVDINALEYLVRMRRILHSPPVAMPASTEAKLSEMINWALTDESMKGRNLVTLKDAQRFLMSNLGFTEIWMEGPNGEPPMANLASEWKKRVVGESHHQVIDKLSRVIQKWARLGFNGPTPFIMLGGPPGSGKDTIIEALNEVLYGNNGRHLMFDISGASGYAVDSIVKGPPIGNHTDYKKPLLLEAMERGVARHAIPFFNEAKDAPAEEMAKFKTFVEEAIIRPSGVDSRPRTIITPIVMAGQYGEELFTGLNQTQISEAYGKLTQQQIDDYFIKANVPPALLDRAKKTGAVVLLRPVLHKEYVQFVKYHILKLKNAQENDNNIHFEVSDSLVEYIAKAAAKTGISTRGVTTLIDDLTLGAINEGINQGLPLRNTKLKLEIVGEDVKLTQYEMSSESVIKTFDIKPSQLSRIEIPTPEACKLLDF